MTFHHYDESWHGRIRAELAHLLHEGRWRSPRTFDALGPVGELEGRAVVSFASNDYLGLSAHPAVVAAAIDALRRWGAGAGASRLVTGSRPVHAELEIALAEWKSTEAAICFPTGFAANLGTLCALGGAGVCIFSDELNHASIIDGCRLARATSAVYRHSDMDHLNELLRTRGRFDGRGPAIVVTDAVFSMDGDTAPLEKLVPLCAQQGALLVLDEAHAALGTLLPEAVGHGGSGAADMIVRVGTLSKTLGSLGGFVAGSHDIVDLLVNRARPYIFSTALPPADAAAALAALRILRSDEGTALTERLAWLVGRMSEAGFAPAGHSSPIIPIVIGGEQAALDASAALLDGGLWVPAIRPPTVPIGTSRLRVTLSAVHKDSDVDRLLDALARILPVRTDLASS